MRGRGSFTAVIAATMAASTFMLLVYGVFADELITDLGIERWQVGLLVTATAGVSAVVSPVVGRRVDAIGARRATVGCVAVAATGLAMIAAAPAYVVLLAATPVAGLGQALANPATNKLIAERVPSGVRGVVTGVKQSGVQVGVFAGGALLPWLADGVGWRLAIASFVVAFLALVPIAVAILPVEGPEAGVATAAVPVPATPGALVVTTSPERPAVASSLPPLVRRLTVYGALLGAGGSAIFTFLPLYAEEVLRTSDATAGAAVAVTGLVGIVARIAWGRAAELRLGTRLPLRAIAILAALATALLVLAAARPVLLWPAAVVTGASASAWNSVGMLAIIQDLPSTETGRASGVVMMGFLAGLAAAPPVFGWSVDVGGSYLPGWTAAALAFAVAAGVVHRPADGVRGADDAA